MEALHWALLCVILNTLQHVNSQQIQSSLERGTSGRVMIRLHNTLGVVCSDYFTSQDAQVVCGSIQGAQRYNGRILSESISGSKVWLTRLGCLGNEQQVDRCPVSGWNPGSCPSRRAAAVECRTSVTQRPTYIPPPTTTQSSNTGFRVALEGGSNARSGRLVVYWYGQPGGVCADNFDTIDAVVVCRQLGYSTSRASVVQYRQTSTKLWLENVQCLGSEASLQNCVVSWNPRTCPRNQQAGVSCGDYVQPPATTITPRPTQPAINFRVELQGGSSSRNGRLVVFYNGQQGEVCSNNFDTRDARVVCRMLGYTPDGAQYQVYTRRTRTAWYKDVNCRGDETSLQFCSSRGLSLVNYCNQVVGVTCGGYVPPTRTPTPTPSPTQPPITFRVELQGGSSSRNGRLVVFYNGQPGEVCSTNFDYRDARVVCRTLGYTQDGAQYQVYTKGTSRVWFTDVTCRGDETSLQLCSIGGWNPSNCNQVVGVTCGGYVPPRPVTTLRPVLTSATPTAFRVELRGGTNSRSGRLVVYYYGQEGNVCSQNFDSQDARVVCRMLGYSTDNSQVQYYSRGTGTIWFSDVNCQGDEASLLSCSIGRWNPTSCNQVVGVSCGGYLPPTNPPVTSPPSGRLEVRLEGGPDRLHGILTLRTGQDVRTACLNNFRQNEVNVVCRMLGAQSNSGKLLNHVYGPGPGLVSQWVYTCQGYETSLDNCQRRAVTQTCGHTQDVSMGCGTLLNGQQPVRVALVGGPSAREGRVEVTYYGQTGTVCANGFDYQDARVVCRMLGYTSSQGIVVLGSRYGAGSRSLPVLLDRVGCNGNEQTLEQCSNEWRRNSCSHSQDVSMRCGSSITVPPPVSNQVFLVDGPDRLHGRLVIQHNGVNGTVCDDQFDDNDAKVVCQMLGHTGSGARAAGSYFGEGPPEMKVWLSDLQCTGSERDLSNCRNTRWGTNTCGHHEDVSVLCGPKVSRSEFTRAYLVDGPDRFHGRLVVEYEYQNGTVCDDRFGEKEATVVCHMLGYWGSGISKTNQYTAGRDGRIWLDEVMCVGNEASIADCFHDAWGQTDCQHSEDIGVNCGPTGFTGGRNAGSSGRGRSAVTPAPTPAPGTP